MQCNKRHQSKMQAHIWHCTLRLCWAAVVQPMGGPCAFKDGASLMRRLQTFMTRWANNEFAH